MTTETAQLKTTRENSSAKLYLQHLFGLLCFALPFFSINYSKSFYFSALSLLIVSVGYVIIVRPSANLSKQEKWLMLALVAYPLWAGIDMLVRENWSWDEFKEPSRFLLIIPVILALRDIKVSIHYLYTGLILGAIWAGSQGLYQQLHLDVYRANGGASHITAFGNISLILGLLSVTVFKAFRKNQKLSLFVAIFALSFGLMGSFSSGSKGGWLALPFLFWIIVDLSDNPTYFKRFISIGVMLCIALLAYFVSPLVQYRVEIVVPAIWEFLLSGSLIDGSIAPRLEMWKASLQIFFQNPIFGSGVGSYYNEKLALIESGLIDPKVKVFVQSHNQLLQSLAEGGILGMLCVYSIYATMIVVFKSHYLNHKPIAVAGIMLVIGFIDFGMADGIWSINNAGTFFAFFSAILIGISSHTYQSSTAN